MRSRPFCLTIMLEELLIHKPYPPPPPPPDSGRVSVKMSHMVTLKVLGVVFGVFNGLFAVHWRDWGCCQLFFIHNSLIAQWFGSVACFFSLCNYECQIKSYNLQVDDVLRKIHLLISLQNFPSVIRDSTKCLHDTILLNIINNVNVIKPSNQVRKFHSTEAFGTSVKHLKSYLLSWAQPYYVITILY